MIRLPAPVVFAEDVAPAPALVVDRTEVADVFASLTRPSTLRLRRKVRGVPYDVGPGPHAHRDRWRARVNRVGDLSAITFDDQGVRLPGGPVRAWRELPKEQPARPALHAALARLCRCTTPEEATESFLAAGLFPSHFADSSAVPKALREEAKRVVLRDGDHSRFGVVQAITYVAHAVNTDPEVRFTMERLAGSYLAATLL